MKKILELGPSQFMTGIAAGSQLQNTGLFTRAEGITTVRNPFLESDEFGILQASPAPEDLTGSVILDTPIAWTIDPVDPDTGFGMLYLWGDDGYLYSIRLDGDHSPVNVNAAIPVSGMTLGANGLFIMEHDNGEKHVWYFRREAIGFYGDLHGSPSFNNDIYGGLEDTTHHPVHKLFDRIYFGNGRFVGLVEDDGAGGLNVDNAALDLQIGMTVTTVSDDGHYLVIGATTNPPVPGGGAGSLPHGTTKILFWDTNSSSWEREWIINDSAVYSIRRVGSVMHALTGRGLYVFTIDTPPQMVLSFMNTGDAPSPQYPSHFMADVLGEALVWANANGSISSWGKFTPAMKNAYMKPFSGFGGSDLSLVCANAKTNDLYVGSGQDALYRVKWTGLDENLPDVYAETIFIDLKRWWQVGRVELEFANRLFEGDSFRVQFKPDRASGLFNGGTAEFAVDGAIVAKEIFTSLEARTLAIQFYFNGAVGLRNISIWGDPISTPTHAGLPIGYAD